MEKFEDWQKSQKRGKAIIIGIGIVIILPGVYDGIHAAPIIIGGLLVGWAAIKWKINRDEYDKENKEKKIEIDNLNKKIEKEKIAKEQKDKPRRDKYENRIKLLDNLGKQLITLSKIDIWNPTESRTVLNVHENEISEKLGDVDLHKILKIVNFISDFSKEVDNIRFAIVDEINVKDFKNKLKYDFQRDHESLEVALEKAEFTTERMDGINTNLYRHVKGGVYGCTRVEALTESIIALGDTIVPTFESEINKIQYLEGLCISMIVFGIEGKKLRYFEILESFEKLGALDSTWQKNIQQRLGSIEAKLDFIIGGILSLNGKMDNLINNGDLVIKELESINSTIATGNVIQALNLYQNYKINKNTKSLNK
jgi:hypothetical protein